MMNQKEVLQVLKDLAVKAGLKIMEIYNTDFQVDYKEDSSPLTAADKAANALRMTKAEGRTTTALLWTL